MQILTSTIAEVFQQAGPEICLKVKEDQMRRILQLVFEGGEHGRAGLFCYGHCSVAMTPGVWACIHVLHIPTCVHLGGNQVCTWVGMNTKLGYVYSLPSRYVCECWHSPVMLQLCICDNSCKPCRWWS